MVFNSKNVIFFLMCIQVIGCLVINLKSCKNFAPNFLNLYNTKSNNIHQSLLRNDNSESGGSENLINSVVRKSPVKNFGSGSKRNRKAIKSSSNTNDAKNLNLGANNTSYIKQLSGSLLFRNSPARDAVKEGSKKVYDQTHHIMGSPK